MGKTRDLLKKIRGRERSFHAKMGQIKDRNGVHLKEAEYIKKRLKEYIEELYKKDINDPDNHDGVSLRAAAAAKSLQSCLTLCDPIDGRKPTRLPCPWDSPGKNTGVGCHFLLQCMKSKSESEVSQSCPTLSDPMDCNLPGSSIHGIFQAGVLE